MAFKTVCDGLEVAHAADGHWLHFKIGSYLSSINVEDCFTGINRLTMINFIDSHLNPVDAKPIDARSNYPATLYARTVNPGTDDAYMMVGETPSEVDATHVGDRETVAPKIGRYELVATGSLHYTEPVYVEDARS